MSKEVHSIIFSGYKSFNNTTGFEFKIIPNARGK